MLLFEGTLNDVAAPGNCLTTLYTAENVTTVYNQMSRSDSSPWIQAYMGSFAVYYSNPGFVVGTVRVQIGQFRPEKCASQYGYGTAQVETRWDPRKDVRFAFFHSGGWKAFGSITDDYDATGVPLPSYAALELKASFAGASISVGDPPSDFYSRPYPDPAVMGPSGACEFVVVRCYVYAGPDDAVREPSFFGDVKIYLEPYVPVPDPSAFWTSLTGTKETL